MSRINIPFVFLIALLAACRTNIRGESEAPAPKEFDNAELFDRRGCLKEDVKTAYIDEMPCLDKNYDGCITRKNWDAFMNFWKDKTPAPGVPLCQQI